MSQRAPGTGVGLWFALASAATFGTSGPFAKSLLVEGWSSGAVVLLRVAGAALALAVPTAARSGVSRRRSRSPSRTIS